MTRRERDGPDRALNVIFGGASLDVFVVNRAGTFLETREIWLLNSQSRRIGFVTVKENGPLEVLLCSDTIICFVEEVFF